MNDVWKNTKRWGWRLVKSLSAIIVIVGIVYWIKYASVAVVSHTVERGTIVSEVMGTGTLEARVETTISPKISGRIVEVLVDQGSRVASGELLVRLDHEELTQQVAIAQANVDVASAEIVRRTTDNTRAAAVYEQARKDRDRIYSLVDSRAVSRSEADKASESLAIAEAEGARAVAGIQEGKKSLVAAEKNLHLRHLQLRDAEIRSPFDGLIVRRFRDAGDVVVPGSPVLTLIATDELWIRAWVDETEMARLRADQSAKVVFRSEPDNAYPGKVVRLGREADRETREFIVDVRVLELPTNWAVGQRAEALIEITRRVDVLLLPARLIVKHDDSIGVFINVNGIAKWRPIRVGVRSRESAEVLEGLTEGDSVVTPKTSTTVLTNGRKVATL